MYNVFYCDLPCKKYYFGQRMAVTLPFFYVKIKEKIKDCQLSKMAFFNQFRPF